MHWRLVPVKRAAGQPKLVASTQEHFGSSHLMRCCYKYSFKPAGLATQGCSWW